jgi:hypothetical protein
MHVAEQALAIKPRILRAAPAVRMLIRSIQLPIECGGFKHSPLDVDSSGVTLRFSDTNDAEYLFKTESESLGPRLYPTKLPNWAC